MAPKRGQKNTRLELAKALKASGYYFISCASIEDGFYGPLLETSPSPQEHLIIDPYTQIPSYLYTMEGLVEEFSDRFLLVKAWEQSSTSPMHGKEYKRKVLNAIFQPLPKP